MALTNAYKNKIVDSLTGNSALLIANSVSSGSSVPDVTMKIGLAYIDQTKSGPEEEGYFVEPSGNGYSRAIIGNTKQPDTRVFPTASNGKATNNKHIYFTEATGPWANGAELTHFVIYSTYSNNTTLVAYALLRNDQGAAAPVKVENKNTVVLFRPEALTIEYTDVV